MAHTPGEWFYDERTQSVGYSGGWLASTAGREGEYLGNEHEDGRLLAAAPLLLKACKAMLPYMDELLDMPHSDSPYYEVYEQAETAIAAGRGDP